MKLGDFLHVSDIPMPPDVKAVTPGDAIVCSVKAKLAEVIETAPTEGEEPVQPAIITAKKPEEGAEE